MSKEIPVTFRFPLKNLYIITCAIIAMIDSVIALLSLGFYCNSNLEMGFMVWYLGLTTKIEANRVT